MDHMAEGSCGCLEKAELIRTDKSKESKKVHQRLFVIYG